MLVYMYICDVIVVLNIFHLESFCILNSITVYIGASWSKPTLMERMIQLLRLQKSVWKYGLMMRVSCIHKSLHLKVSC